MAGGHRVVPDRHFRLSPDLGGGVQRLLWIELAPCSPDEVDAHLHRVFPKCCAHHSDGVVRGRTGLAWLCAAEVATTLRPRPGNRHPRHVARPVAFAAFFTGLLGPFILTNYVGFLFVAIAATFLYTWIFNHTKGSVLLATLTHGFGDATNSLIILLIPAQLVIDPGKFISGWARPLVYGGWNGDNIVIFGAFVVLLLVFTRGRLGYNPERNAQLIE